MLLDVMRFNLFGLDLVQHETGDGKEQKGTAQSKGEDRKEMERDLSIGEYLERGGYGDGFKEDYLLVSRSPRSTSLFDVRCLNLEDGRLEVERT